MMPGMIMLWNGSVATIPSGWHLCDGTVGTPDLRDRFIVCARQDDSGVAKTWIYGFPTKSGDDITHTHSFTGDGHAHDLTEGVDIDRNGVDGYYKHTTNVSPASGDTDVGYHVPKYYALCYIMKL